MAQAWIRPEGSTVDKNNSISSWNSKLQTLSHLLEHMHTEIWRNLCFKLPQVEIFFLFCFVFLLVKNHLYTRIRIKQSTQNIKFVLLTENNKKSF